MVIKRGEIGIRDLVDSRPQGDEVARGITEALKEVKTDVAMVARIVGTNQEEGNRILAEAHIATAPTFAEAVQIAVKMAK